MDRITESLLNEFTKEHELGHLDESKRFEYFSSYVVIKREHSATFGLTDVVVGDGLDSKEGSDTGIDSIAILVNGILIADPEELQDQLDNAGYLDVVFVFIQAETRSGFDSSKIGNFGFGVGDFFKETPSLIRNTRVQNAAEIMKAVYQKSGKFKRGNPTCKLFYVTTGKWRDETALVARVSTVESDLKETGLFKNVEFIPLGAEDVQKLYQRTKNTATAEFNFPNRITVSPEIQGVEQAYFGFLPWGEFKKLITNESGKLVSGLFFDNIRDWQGYNEVNSEIRSTLESATKNRFVLMNNGLTVIARELHPTGDKFRV